MQSERNNIKEKKQTNVSKKKKNGPNMTRSLLVVRSTLYGLGFSSIKCSNHYAMLGTVHALVMILKTES